MGMWTCFAVWIYSVDFPVDLLKTVDLNLLLRRALYMQSIPVTHRAITYNFTSLQMHIQYLYLK